MASEVDVEALERQFEDAEREGCAYVTMFVETGLALCTRLRAAEQDRDDVRTQLEAMAEDARRLEEERDEARAALGEMQVRLDAYDNVEGRSRAVAIARAEAAEARVAELEARLPVDGSHMPSIVDLLEDEVATLRAIADAAAALLPFLPEGGPNPQWRHSAHFVAADTIRAALAARAKDGAR